MNKFTRILVLIVAALLASCGEGTNPNLKTTPDTGGSYVAEKAVFTPSTDPVVYRFAKYSSGAYFYTGSGVEAQTVINSYPDFRYEGPVFGHDVSAQGLPVYRFANVTNGGYFFTGSAIERDATIKNYPNMRFEGSTFSSVVPTAAGAQPVYRLANLNNGAYLYTVSSTEKDYAISLGMWRFEGVTFYAPANVTPPLPTPTPTISALNCGVARVNSPWQCVLTGTLLNSSVIALASGCTPSEMTKTGLPTATEITFSCTPVAVGAFQLELSYLAGTSPATKNVLSSTSFTALAALPPDPIATSLNCTPAIVGSVMICTLIGTNLTSAIVATATNCSPATMSMDAVQSPTRLIYSCTPLSAGQIQVNALTYVGPGLSQNLIAPYVATVTNPVVIPPSPTATSFGCTPAIAGSVMTCTLIGTNLTSAIVATATNCSPATMAMDAVQSPTRLIYSCTPINIGQIQVSIPNLITPYGAIVSAPPIIIPPPSVTDYVCNYPSTGFAFNCELTGTNLPDGITLRSSACPNNLFVERTGGTGSFRRFSCTATATGGFTMSYVIPNFNGQITIRYDALLGGTSAIVSDWVCNYPSAGFDYLCEMSGTNLPAGISLTSASCANGAFVEQAGGTSIFRRFSCPATSSTSVSITPTIPNLGQLASLRYDRLLGGTSTLLSDFVCNYPSIGQDFICEVTGTNLPVGISITSAACNGGVFSEQAGGTSRFRRFACTANTSGSFSLSRSIPNLGQTVAIRYDRFLDWGSGNPQVPATAGAATTCGFMLGANETPVSSTAGEFKLASSDCFVSLKLNASDWSSIINGNGFNIDTKGYSKRFASVFKDSFDFVMFVIDGTDIPPSFGYYGLYTSFDVRTPTRTRRQLGHMVLPYILTTSGGLNPIEGGPILHELMHEWGNKGAVVSPTDAGHWGFSSVGGQLGGWDGAAGVENLGGGKWRAKGPRATCLPSATAAQVTEFCSPKPSFGTFANGGNSVEYAPLELMLMGLISPSTVPDIKVAFDGTYTNYSLGEFTATDWRTYSAASIMTGLGAKAPNVLTAQKHFRVATVVLTNRDNLDSATVNRLNKSLEQFSLDGVNPSFNYNPAYISIHNFYTATKGLAKIRAGQLSQELR
jgi:Repeat of unknown function (DUF5648)